MSVRISWLLVVGALAVEPNPPTWPSTVRVFKPQDTDIQSVVDAAYAANGGQTPDDHGQFSDQRFAFLFSPGTYSVSVPVGYYTEVLGLGEDPSEVVFASSKGVYCEEASFAVSPGALDTFWRGAANFQTNADYPWNNGLQGMIWAASQATSLRRIIVKNDLTLYEYRQGEGIADYASGGYVGNAKVNGAVHSGSQQQFMARNSEVTSWTDGVCNMVFVGVEGAPESHCSANLTLCSHPFVTVENSAAIAEKPFISVDASGKFYLNIPKAATGRRGVDFKNSVQVGFEQVYVAQATDDAATINKKLQQGLHVVLTPGIYELDEPLVLNKKGQVLLGLGLATVIPTTGKPAVQVGNIDDVRVAGLLFEAGPKMSDTLLQWGTSGYKGDQNLPGVMSDIYARVGGPKMPTETSAK